MYVGREFSIVSKLPKQRYLDVVNNNVVIKSRNGTKTQKWVFDYKSRTIVNVATGTSLNWTGGNEMVSKTTSEWGQLYKFRGELI
jgi:hypothetical protein